MPRRFTPQTAPAALEDLRARLRATRWPDAPEDAGWSLGHRPRLPARARRLLGRRVRLAGAGGGARPAAALPRPARRPRDPLRARPGRRAGRARPAAGPQPRLAGLVLALHEGHPAAHRPRRARRRPGRRVRRGRARHAGLRLLRPPDRPAARLHRRRRPVGRADERPRLPAVRRGGRRHRQPREPLPRARPPRPGRGRPPHRRGPARLHRRPGRPHARGARLARRAPRPGARPRAPTPRCTARSRRPPPFGLTDSPAGLAAWIVEKLRAWSDCGGDVERRFTKDEILTNVTIYWLTGTIGSSMRMYRANAAIPPAQHARRVEVPSGFSLFPGDVVRPPRAWLERTANVVRVTEPAARRALRAVRGARALRAGAARVLPPLPVGMICHADRGRAMVRPHRRSQGRAVPG